MVNKTAKILILLIGLAVAAALVCIGFLSGALSLPAFSCSNVPSESEHDPPLVPKMPIEGQLSVYFVDVGQGDAAVLISPSGKTMLIDSGESIYANRMEKLLKTLGVERIDLMVGTHSHSDHIGSMPRIIKGFETGGYITTAEDIESDYSSAVETALNEKGVPIRKVWCGDIVEWDEECGITVISPILGCEYSQYDANDGCLMLRIEYGETAFIFTADATVHAEQLSMFHNEKELFMANVLKVAHHGSTTSSSIGFLETVDADIAVISVGASNPYGHPDFDILSRLNSAGCSVVRTDERGTVAAFSDSKTVTIEYQKPER